MPQNSLYEHMPEELHMQAVMHEVGDRAARVKSAAQIQMEPSAREEREKENECCRAGMRDAAKAILGEDQLKRIMSRVRLQLLKAMRESPSLGNLTEALGAHPKVLPPT
eukprot:6460104-Amphidinium_carterae.1